MSLDLERIRLVFVEQMEHWLALLSEEDRARPFVGGADGELLTPEDMVREVRDGTEWGNGFAENAIGLLAARSFSSASPLPAYEVAVAKPPPSTQKLASGSMRPDGLRGSSALPRKSPPPPTRPGASSTPPPPSKGGRGGSIRDDLRVPGLSPMVRSNKKDDDF